VLRDPGTDQFANAVKFLANNIDQRVQKWLRGKHVLDQYSPDSPNLGAILVLVSVLLEEPSFGEFITRIGNVAISRIIEANNPERVGDAARFCFAVPDKFLGEIIVYLPKFVAKI
jgi:hypothetical protein